MRRGPIHHVELWVTDIERAGASWGWLLERLGYHVDQTFDGGVSWRYGDAYVVVEASPAVRGGHDRLRAGLNHLAFWGGSRADVEQLARDAVEHGWSLMFTDRHPFAGGADHHAAYLENADGFEVEIVADE